MILEQTDVDAAVEAVYRQDWGRIVATLIRQTNDFELAEDTAQEAFAAALAQWRAKGIPQTPAAWILGVARHKAIDAIRRRVRHRQILATLPFDEPEIRPEDESDIPDDRLRLICTCCHPALGMESQVALTLRTLGGLTTEGIARAFLVPEPTMAQRLVRAKRKIATAGIPYAIPDKADMPERLNSIMAVLYLVFNEGYTATGGESLTRADLCAEAIRLARLVLDLIDAKEATALLALMLLHDSRRHARQDAEGNLIVLEDQDRTLWNQAQIAEALPLVERSLGPSPGPFALQAAIAALHCGAGRMQDTDWPQILRLYDLLAVVQPSPVVALNRAVALAMVEGPRAALTAIDGLAAGGELDRYHLLHAARADLLRRLDALPDAARAYTKALELVDNEAERRFLERRLREIGA